MSKNVSQKNLMMTIFAKSLNAMSALMQKACFKPTHRHKTALLKWPWSRPLKIVPLTAAFLMLGAIGTTNTATADEPAEAFVKALIDARYYDIASDYLENAQTNDLVSAEFRQTIPYERAKMLVRSAAVDRSPEAREAKFNEADQLLNTYARQLTDERQKINVLLESANIKLRRAEILIRRSSNDRLTSGESSEILKNADTLLRSALQQYQNGRAQLRSTLQNFRLDPEDPKSGEEKRGLERKYLSIRTQVPLVTEMLADTLAADSPERRKLLEEAVSENESVYKKYRRVKKQAFVFEAAINGARAAQKIGKDEKALELLDYVFEIGNGPAENRLKKNAFTVAVGSWDKIKPYPFAKVIKLLEGRVARLNRAEQKDSEWERIQLELARAQLEKANAVRAAGGTGASSDAKTLTRSASKLVRKIARSPSLHRDRAKTLIETWDLSFSASDAEEAPREIKTFEDARDFASEKLATIVELQNEVGQQIRAIRSIRDPAKRADAQTEIDEKQEMLNEKANSALEIYENALALANDSTDRADINSIRYFQSLCYYAKGLPLQSALIAEFLLDKYPTVDWTRQASANIVKGYSALLAEAQPDDRAYEQKKLANACREICSRWPGSNEAALAAATIVQNSIRDKDIATAEEFFKLIPNSFSGKPTLAAALGEKLWVDYRLNGKLDDAQRKQRLDDANAMLRSAVSDSPDNVTYPKAKAALTLVGVLVEQGKIEDAVTQLESAEIAPLDLIKQKHPAITRTRFAESFRQSTWRTAIKTYLAAIGAGGDQSQSMAKATGVLSAMQGELKDSDDPKAAARLTSIYRSVGKSLNEQYEGLQTLDERKRFAEVLASFVGTIEQGSSDTATVLWAGSTILKVASTLAEEGATAEADPLFKQAVSALDHAKALGVESSNDKLALKRLQALAFRGSGQFGKSVDIFVEILKEKSGLTLQMDAAETLQMWGSSKQDANAYAKAMMGTGLYTDNKRKKNAIWGWRKLVQVTRGNDKLNDPFRTALYNSVKSRFEYGLLKKNQKAIDSAYSELTKSIERFDFLTVAPWNKKIEALLAEMKKNLK